MESKGEDNLQTLFDNIRTHKKKYTLAKMAESLKIDNTLKSRILEFSKSVEQLQFK